MATVFKFVDGGITAYEFAEGPSSLDSHVMALMNDLIKEFSLYIEVHGLGNQVALEHGEFRRHEAKEILTEVDFDLPLTLTKLEYRDGKEFITLHFASGDRENPFNWNPWYKRSVTT